MKYKTISKVKTIIPCSRKIDAVYRDSKNKDKLWRHPVVAYALVIDYDVDENHAEEITLKDIYDTLTYNMSMERLVALVNPDAEEDFILYGCQAEADNLLGYEYDGIQRKWDEEDVKA